MSVGSGIASGISNVLIKIFRRFIMFSPAVKVGVFAWSLIVALNSWFRPMWDLTFQNIDKLVVPVISDPTLDLQILSTVNYIFPFDTLLTFMVQFVAFRTVLTVIRVAKSWIPTVN